VVPSCAPVGSKLSETEFMQNRSPVGVCGASSKTWPRCEPQLLHSTSVRTMPILRSSCSSTASFSVGWEQLGQPQWASNLVVERNSSAPQARQWYTPTRSSCSSSPVPGRSVAACRSTWYSSGSSSACHCSSDLLTLYMPPLSPPAPVASMLGRTRQNGRWTRPSRERASSGNEQGAFIHAGAHHQRRRD